MVTFLHYRVGERDGVSLEIEKRVKVLQALGHETSFISGFDGIKRENSIEIPELDISTQLNKFLRTDIFAEGNFSEDTANCIYRDLENKLITAFTEAFAQLNPNLIFVHNIFSHGYNLPATTALLKVLDKNPIPTVALHHDFWFEREKFLNPKYPFITPVLKNTPPHKAYIHLHQVINSLAQDELLQRSGIRAQRIGDYFDYSADPGAIDEFSSSLPEDLGIKENDVVVLQATRITPRKAIENAITFVSALEKKLHQHASISVNGKKISKESRVVLLLSNFVEVDDKPYFDALEKFATKAGIKIIWAGHKFATSRSHSEKGKIYSFWDAYHFADLITYPSTWEGFGNQFLEAIFYKILTVVFEYPVFEKDIKNEGYFYISLGNKFIHEDGLQIVPHDVINQAVDETISYLSNKTKLNELLSKNVSLAKKYHDESLLIKSMTEILKLSK